MVVDYYRRSPPEEPVPIDSVQLFAPDGSADRIMEQEKATYLRQAMWKLTTAQQQVIALRFLEGLSNEEVADIMSKTVGSVKALQHRALASLRRILEKENVQF